MNKEERLMMSKEEARNRAKELLNENQVDLITKYMFLEQQCKKQKEINKKAIEYIKKAQLGEFPTGVIYWLKDDEVGKKLLQILEDKEVSE